MCVRACMYGICTHNYVAYTHSGVARFGGDLVQRVGVGALEAPFD